MSSLRIYEWYKRFKEGREDIGNEKRTERPNISISKENVIKIGDIVLSNR